jgi:outer membrane protein OmpA-like peptidoglycan-associated protein
VRRRAAPARRRKISWINTDERTDPAKAHQIVRENSRKAEAMPRITQWAGLAVFALTVASTLALAHVSAGDRVERWTIAFERGDRLAAGAGAQIETIAARLASDESLEAVIVGHTGTLGDAAANQRLSAERARLVRDRLLEVMRTQGDGAADRIQTFGAGGSVPLPRPEGVGDRAYQRQLARATVDVSVALP